MLVSVDEFVGEFLPSFLVLLLDLVELEESTLAEKISALFEALCVQPRDPLEGCQRYALFDLEIEKVQLLHLSKTDLKAKQLLALLPDDNEIRIHVLELGLNLIPHVLTLSLHVILCLLDSHLRLTEPGILVDGHFKVSLPFELELLVRPLILSLRACHEGLVHHVLVLEEGEILCGWRITDLELSILLSLLVSDLLDVVLVAVVDHLSLSVLTLVCSFVGASLLVCLPLLDRLVNMIDVVSAVSACRCSHLRLLNNLGACFQAVTFEF